MADEFLERPTYSLADLPASELPEDPFERAAMRTQRSVLNRNDTGRFDIPPSTLASIGVGFAPGSGFADAFGVLPNFEQGGHHPSLFANLWNGDISAAGWQALGALGDGMYLVPTVGPVLGPTVGTALKAPRVGQLGQRAATGASRQVGGVAQTDLPRREFPKGAPPHITNLVQNQAMRDELLKIIKEAREKGAHWYDTQPLRQKFINELGPDRGEAAFLKYLNFVAATSPMSDVGTNIRNASHYFSLFTQGKPLPAVGDLNPKGYGHFISDDHQRFALKVAGEGLDPLQYPKMTSYNQNLAGNYAPVTVDMHALRLPAIIARDKSFLKRAHRERLERGEISMDDAVANPSWWRGPNPNEYPTIERLYKEVAEQAGLTPAQAQAAAWVGGGHRTGVRSNRYQSFMGHFWDRIDRTAIKNGVPHDEVLRQFIQGQMKLVLRDGAPIAVA